MIYFDNGATSLPKPSVVFRAASRAATLGNPGRGGHRLALEGAKLLYSVRERAALHFEADTPEHICFFSGATEALCRVIKSLVPRGGRLLFSDMEHNAVRRPVLALAKRGVAADVFHGYGSKEEILASFKERLKSSPRLAVFLHTSNVCPQTLPVKELCALCKKEGVLSLVDCAQAGGHLPISLKDLQADGLVFAGHKGLFGFQGAGMLVCSQQLKRALEEAETLVEGGSGSLSLEEGMPPFLPERLEAGTPALPAIASMGAGLAFIERMGYEEIGARLSGLYRLCAEGLREIRGIELCAPKASGSGPLLFDASPFENAPLAAALSDQGVYLREGLHCAPLAHQTIGSLDHGGIRVSFSAFNTPKEVERFLKILQREVRALA